MARREWFALDIGFLGDHKICELGSRFGPSGPLMVVAMYAAAKAQEEGGRFTIGFKNLSRAAFISRTKRTREIVAKASELSVVQIIEMDPVGFTATIPKWDEWQFGSGITAGAKRTAKWRKGRHGDVTEPSREASPPSVTVTGTDTYTDTVKAKAFTSEVVSLCDLLADLAIANGGTERRLRDGAKSDRWRNEARLLFDRDGVSNEEAERVLRWSQADSFEQNVVLSMPKFRERFDQLRGKATRTNVVRLHPSEQRAQEIEALTEQWRREDDPPPPEAA